MTISGVISGAANIAKSTASGTLVFSGNNTYSGKTTINSGTLSVSSLNKVTAGSASSSLGAPTTVANGTISIGATTFAGKLLYTGVGETTDRVLDMSGTTGGATVENDGSGAVTFTSTCTASGAGVKTLTLQGSNTGANTIAKIVNSTSATALTKAQAGTWVLAGANTYTGATAVTGGTLDLASGGSIGASAVTVSSGATLGSVTTSTTTIGGNTTLSSGGKAAFTATGGASSSVGKISVTGTLTLNNNAITINVSGAPLAAGTYRLMDCTATEAGAANATPTITGVALAGGYTATVSTTTGAAGHVDLIVQSAPVFSGISSQSIAYGTASITLGGTLSSSSGPTTVYPASGDTVSATINGHTVNGTVIDPTGDFSITYNDPSLATDGVSAPYTITYAYGGNPAVFVTAASDATTTLTVTPAALTVTANNDSKIYGQTKTYGPGSIAFMTSPLQNGEMIGTVTITASGGTAANSPVTTYTLTPSAATGGTFNPANYNIAYVNGTLTVNPLAVVLTGTRMYDGTATAAASILSVANKVGSDDVTVASGSANLASAHVGAQAITSAGTLALGGAAAGNYTLVGVSGSVTITTLTVTITSQTFDSTGPSDVITFTSVAGVTYHVLATTDISQPQSSWTDVSGPLVATGTSTSFTVDSSTSITASLPGAYFSIRVDE